MALAFVKFLFVRLLTVVLRIIGYGCNGPGEFWGMILDSFFIGTLVLIILALTKKGVRIMHEKSKQMLDRGRGQKPQYNEQKMKRRSILAWV